MRKFLYLLLCLLLLALVPPVRAQAPPAGFVSTLVSDQWNEAVGLTFNASGSHMFVWERGGKVWVVNNGQRALLLDISPEVGAWNDHGLLGFALHPQFETNGYFYLFYLVDRHYLMNFGTPAYSATANDYFSASISRLTRYTATRSGTQYSVNLASRKILLGATKSTGVICLERSHSAGSLVFGADGTLLASVGDGAHGSDNDYGSNPNTYYAQALADGMMTSKDNVGAFRAQAIDCLNGKILRLDPETGAGVPSNPYYVAADPQAPRSKVWALGFRNPFRMTRKPGTGSTNPADGNPGTLYVGDVGYFTWEEVDVVSQARQNMGWPLFEGLEPNTTYQGPNQYNFYAPNPQYGVNGCTQQYFYFKNLLVQATPSGTATFTNSCGGQAIPASIPTFVHTRPLIDWHHDTGPSRTGIFSGSTPGVVNIGAAGSPVSGPQFGGSASVGGVFYPYTDFPAQYQNTYFFGDYSGGWIRNMTVSGTNTPSAVRDFVSADAVPVYLAVHPTTPGLYYVNFPSEIRKVTYSPVNQPPVAVASSNLSFGASPLSVQFTGTASTDPENQALTYRWDFGDGTTSTVASPTHSFVTPTTAPTAYTVRLTVTDPQGQTGQATLLISANNTPPQVTITSPAPNTLYSIASQTSFVLRATVTDQEHSPAQLSYQWQSFLHHADHEHPEPIQTTTEGSLTTTPVGCGAETYYYRVVLTVTDAAGLATTREIRLNPDCSTAPTYAFYRAINVGGTAVSLDGNAWEGGTAPGFATNGATFSTTAVPLVPATDAPRTSMIRSSAWKVTGLTATLSGVPAGQYRVWAYVWEDNNPEVFSLSLNGLPVEANYNSGSAGTWAKLGPYDVSVTAAGTLALTSTGGTVNLSGLEVWRSTSTPPTNQPPAANAGPDQTLTLPTSTAQLLGSGTDPDGTINTYTWSQVSGPNTAAFSSLAAAQPTVSGLVAGTYVFSLVVTDNGGASSTPDQVSVQVNASGGTSYAFYRAINVGGAAVSLDGNAWEGGTAPGFATNGATFSTTAVPLVPATDAPRTSMIRSSAWKVTGLTATLSGVPAGQYRVWAYVWEDNNPEVFSLSLNGLPVEANYNSGSAGTWAKLGPYDVSVTAAGTLALTSTGGTVNLSGLEVWRSTSTPPTNQPPAANAGPDQTLTLPTSTAQLLGSGTDPDGTINTYTWSQVSGPNTAAFSSLAAAQPTVSGLVAGTYVFSLVVTDNGGASSTPDQVSVQVNASGGTSYAFYRAINVGGAAVSLDGNAWEGGTAPGFATNGATFSTTAVPLVPATDAPRTSMIRSSAWKVTGLTATLSGVPAGQYRVWAYVWEDNNPEVFSLSLNGLPVEANYNSGSAGTWAKLGPYDVSVTAAGTLALTSTGGTVNLSGLEVWRGTGAVPRPQTALATPATAVPQVTLYPNPSPSGRYTLNFPAAPGPVVQYSLLAPLGRTVGQGELQLAPGSKRAELDVSQLPLQAGVYFLRITGPGRPTQFRLIR
ncbi:PKD domain-containing protein [Hymenobacter yonginensis]|uniref:PKD domain-containing protein n=1 Tax=Hymenobacter yonginensis TaxID=748197 RepID=A0ABY7PLY4_9BACT|nr:PKD domain-containing protein [Hymenobacter yonginensis]WBO83288.1 PKD domain-containing protein [Hymenobacter yonginensis]